MKFTSENLQRDVLVLTASRGVRAFAFSYLNIIFAIYLNQLGYSTMTVGLVISTAFASGAVLTAVWGFLSDRYGRKKVSSCSRLLRSYPIQFMCCLANCS